MVNFEEKYEETEDIINGTVEFLKNNYVTQGQVEHVKANLPEDLRVLV
jgi:hypothetical protein